MGLLHTIVAFIVALGLLIVVHEYGHYLIARLCGVKVLRFSVGFGRALFTKRIGRDQTEWVVAAIPFGGYVKMLDEREGPVEPHEAARAFNRQSVWRRFAIVVAGRWPISSSPSRSTRACSCTGCPRRGRCLARRRRGASRRSPD